MSLEQNYTAILGQLGEDVSREGLLDTPKRAAKALKFLTQGYEQKLEDIVGQAIFTTRNDEMVIVRDIELYSLCEHHLLPFIGRAHVAYLPARKVIGLSKIPRIVDMFSKRLQLQERLTVQVAGFLMERLEPKGVACVVEATHLCTMMRGVKKQEATMVTSSMTGTFRRDARTRAEFMGLIGKGGTR
jgi:GTP cyclohydrolase I